MIHLYKCDSLQKICRIAPLSHFSKYYRNSGINRLQAGKNVRELVEELFKISLYIYNYNDWVDNFDSSRTVNIIGDEETTFSIPKFSLCLVYSNIICRKVTLSHHSRLCIILIFCLFVKYKQNY